MISGVQINILGLDGDDDNALPCPCFFFPPLLSWEGFPGDGDCATDGDSDGATDDDSDGVEVDVGSATVFCIAWRVPMACVTHNSGRHAKDFWTVAVGNGVDHAVIGMIKIVMLSDDVRDHAHLRRGDDHGPVLLLWHCECR